MPEVGIVYIEAPKFDGSTHWEIYLKQFETAAYVNHWMEKEKEVLLVFTLKGPAAELLQKVPPDN